MTGPWAAQQHLAPSFPDTANNCRCLFLPSKPVTHEASPKCQHWNLDLRDSTSTRLLLVHAYYVYRAVRVVDLRYGDHVHCPHACPSFGGRSTLTICATQCSVPCVAPQPRPIYTVVFPYGHIAYRSHVGNLGIIVRPHR